MFKANVVAHSIGHHNIPIISVEATYPRIIHAEIMTHRDRARNAASSRAIPWKRFKKGFQSEVIQDEFNRGILPLKAYLDSLVPNCMYRMVMENPFIPISFDMEQKGMQSGNPIEFQDAGIHRWLKARSEAVYHADKLADMGVHKSIVNRIVEPWMWITVLMTATEWKNFFRLRCHPAAEKHFQKIAGMIRQAIAESKPRHLEVGEWHLPYITDSDYKDVPILPNREALKYISAGRAARVSYLTHDGKRDPAEDIRLCEQLINPPSAGLDDDVIHASPLEHQAQCLETDLRSGPFRGWKQFRKEFKNENVEG